MSEEQSEELINPEEELIADAEERSEYDESSGCRPYPSQVLRTAEDLLGNPRLYVPIGRPQSDPRKNGEGEELPPSLSDPDGVTATPGMKKFFHVYRAAALRKADHFFQRSVPEMNMDNVREHIQLVHRHDDSDIMREEEVVEEMLVDDTLMEEMSEPIAEEEVELEEHEPSNDKDLQDESGSIYNDLSIDIDGAKVVQHYCDDAPLYSERAIDFQEACDILTGVIRVPAVLLCKTPPKEFKGQGTFLVDLSSFDNRHDVALDNLGHWGKPAGRTRYFELFGNELRKVDDKGMLPAGATYTYKCMMKRYSHPAVNNGSRFIKRIVTALFPPQRQEVIGVAVITYEWEGTPYDFPVNRAEVAAKNSRHRSYIPPPPDGSRSWEIASYSSSGFNALPDSCHAYTDHCPLYSTGALVFKDAADIILGATYVDPRRVCTRVPQCMRESCTFVLSMEEFGSDYELRRDNNGSWGKPAGSSRYFKIGPSPNECTRVDRNGKVPDDDSWDFQVMCKRYEHPQVNNRFVRKIYIGRIPDPLNRNYMHNAQLAVIVYYWKGDPEPFQVTKKQNNVRVNHSTHIELMKESSPMMYEVVNGADGSIVHDVYGEGEGEEGPSLHHLPGSSSQPSTNTRKRKAMGCGGSDVQGGQSRFNLSEDGPGGQSEMEDLRMLIYRKELENQHRLSSLLDRGEAMLDRLERAADVVLKYSGMDGEEEEVEEEEILTHHFEEEEVLHEELVEEEEEEREGEAAVRGAESLPQ